MIIGATAALLIGAPAGAHHGWSEYDSGKPLTLNGTIRQSGYEHPHGHVRLETPGKTWTVILAPPTRMENRGLPRAALKPGTLAVVAGYPHRSHSDELRAERITVHGKTIELR
jgi:hypothetical protein